MVMPIVLTKSGNAWQWGIREFAPLRLWNTHVEVWAFQIRRQWFGVWVNESLYAACCWPRKKYWELFVTPREAQLTYQYERGYAAGIKKVLDNPEAFASLEPAEREAMTAVPPYEGQQ